MQPPTDNSAQSVWPPPPTGLPPEPAPLDPVLNALAFKRWRTILVLIGSIITIGVLQVVWLYVTARKLKEIRPQSNVAPEAFLTLLILDIGSTILEFMHPDPALAWDCFNLAWVSAMTVYMFMLRNQINILLGNDPRKNYWMGALGTFFFSATFMNYKLNRAMDAAKATQTSTQTSP